MRIAPTIRQFYITASVVLLNTFLLFVALNLVFFVRQICKSRAKRVGGAVVREYGFERLRPAYPGWKDDDLLRFFDENIWSLEYASFVGFRENPQSGRYVSVSEHGFRPVKQQEVWPPDPNDYVIFVFGGSTTAGFGVPDDQTIPSHLQEQLCTANHQVRVFNFGRCFYFSSQERVLFEKLLIQGRQPDLAIFIDGLNDFYYADGEPHLTNELQEMMASADKTTLNLRTVINALPLVKQVNKNLPERHPNHNSTNDGEYQASRATAVIERWLRNRRVIESVAAEFGVSALFVWQPVPTYDYDLQHHLLRDLLKDDYQMENMGHHRLSSVGYPLMNEYRKQHAMGDKFLWLGGLQHNRKENLYVDTVHYTETFSREIASSIASFVISRGIIPAETLALKNWQ